MFRDRECFKFRFQNFLIHRLPSIGNKFVISPHLRLGRVKRRVYGDTMVSWHNQTHLSYNKTIISRCFGQPWIIIHVISLIVAGFLQCGFRASRSVTEIDFPFSLSLIIMIINRRTSVFYVISKCHQFFQLFFLSVFRDNFLSFLLKIIIFDTFAQWNNEWDHARRFVSCHVIIRTRQTMGNLEEGETFFRGYKSRLIPHTFHGIPFH